MTGFLLLTGLIGLGIGVWLGMPGRYTQSPDEIERALGRRGERRKRAKRSLNPLAWLQRRASAKGSPSRGRRQQRARKGFSLESPDDRKK